MRQIFIGGEYLKVNEHKNNPQTIGESKVAITAKISEIPKECVRVIDNFAQHMQVCFQRRGAYFEMNVTFMQRDQ